MTWRERLFGRARLEDQLDAELQDHLAHQTDEYRQQGLGTAEAPPRARPHSGPHDVVK